MARRNSTAAVSSPSRTDAAPGPWPAAVATMLSPSAGIPVFGSLVSVELGDNHEMVSINSSLAAPNLASYVAELSPLDALKLAPTMTVADVGAGTGYFTVRLAKRVAKVYATDAQPEMLKLLKQRTASLANVEAVLAGDRDAALPEHCCDLILLVDVYHELADPAAVVAGLRRALRDGGRLVLVGGDPAPATGGA